ncbi:TetR family transcriptional regulator [Streptomyces sp. M1013]|uniref:TetR/AcrR family transcriptional regulator n=1 Tax=Streptomyces sp. M1013 TaxID=549798 RepID=UPI000978DA33|nr:TetR family transcriptional regulator [Streptomyces sp. M1013]OMI90693.1 TetR family transcriptional regulator [Streptomyces sp. M1013]
MATRSRRPERRQEPLSRERIVEAAVELLDTVGERGLTFRALAERLSTGPGAIYWHITGKAELLTAATDAVVAAAVSADPADPAGAADPADSPQDAIRAVALGLFDATEAHPWLAAQLATQLSRSPWGTVAPRIFESLGRQVRAMGVPEADWFTASSALMHYILGAAGQNTANSASAGPSGHGDVDRDEFLDTVSTAWEGLDPEEYPFTRAVADQVRGHDDREQFLSGITLVLAGITALHRPGR